MLRVGLIGYGRWGKILAREINNTNSMILTSICHLSASEDDFYFKTLSRLLQYSNPTALVIASPLCDRDQLIMEGLIAGKPLFVEKPICRPLLSVCELRAISRSNHIPVFTNYIHAYSHGVQAAINNLDKIGNLKEITIVFSQPGPTYEHEDAMTLLGCHALAIAYRLIAGDSISYPLFKIHEYTLSSKREKAFLSGMFQGSECQLSLRVDLNNLQKTRKIRIDGSLGHITISLTGSSPGVKVLSWGNNGPLHEFSIPTSEKRNLPTVLNLFCEVVEMRAKDNLPLTLSVQTILDKCAALQS